MPGIKVCDVTMKLWYDRNKLLPGKRNFSIIELKSMRLNKWIYKRLDGKYFKTVNNTIYLKWFDTICVQWMIKIKENGSL